MNVDPELPNPIEPEVPGQPTSRWLKKVLRKGLVLVGVALAIGAVLHFTPLQQLLEDLQSGKDHLKEMGWVAPLAFAGMTAFFVMVGVPRLVFCLIGGLSFGFVQGLLWSQLGTLVGAYFTYIFARYFARGWVWKKLENLPRLNRFLANPSIVSVILARQIPIGGVMINLALGVSRVRSGQFFLGSLLGFLPEAILVTLIGSGLGKDSLEMMVLQIGLFALLLLTGLWWLWKYGPFRELIRKKWKTDL